MSNEAAIATDTKAPKIPVQHQVAVGLARSAERLNAVHATLSKWGLTDLAQDIKEAVFRLDATKKALEEKPADWKPIRTRAPNAPLVTGAKVSLREKIAGQYDGILDGDERNLVVESERGKKVFCMTPSGAKVLIDRSHLVARS